VCSSDLHDVVVFGESASSLVEAFAPTAMSVTVASGLQSAVEAASSLALPGDAVVLSPACASFDEFANYEQRGHVFKRLVSGMTEKQESR